MAIASFIRKTRTAISNTAISDGQIFLETDQGNNSKIYMDNGTERIEIGGKNEIQDNLTSTSSVDALSANQGKILKDYFDTTYNTGNLIVSSTEPTTKVEGTIWIKVT